MSFTLYELTGRYKELLDYIGDEENAEQFADTLEMLEDDINTKVDNIGKLIKSIDAETKALDEEKKRLEQRISSRKNNVLRLKQYLQDSLEGLDMEKVKTPMFSVWIQNNPQSVLIENEESIPEQFKIPQPAKIDKKAILDALKNDETIEGATIQQTRGLRLR